MGIRYLDKLLNVYKLIKMLLLDLLKIGILLSYLGLFCIFLIKNNGLLLNLKKF